MVGLFSLRSSKAEESEKQSVFVASLCRPGESVAKDKKPSLDEDQQRDWQASTSALLYLLTEQQAMIGRLLQELLQIGALDNEGLSRVTDTDATPETRISIYTSLYNRYVGYTQVCRKLIDDLQDNKP